MAYVPLRHVIQVAFGLNAWQVEAGPSWINEERFDIIAMAEAPVLSLQLWLMLRTLLADRFKLAAHMQTRDAPSSPSSSREPMASMVLAFVSQRPIAQGSCVRRRLTIAIHAP